MGKGESFSDEEEAKLEELYVEEGMGPTAIAKKLDRPVDSVKTKIKTKKLTPKKVPKQLAKEAEDSIIVETAKEIAHDAKEVHEDIVNAGRFIYNNFLTTARAKGLSLTEYIQRAMVFYVNYEDLIGKLEKKIMDLGQIIEEQKKTIDELSVYLSPIPYRVKIIELMILQEKRGELTFSDAEVRMYLDAIDYAVTKDIVQQPKQPRRVQEMRRIERG